MAEKLIGLAHIGIRIKDAEVSKDFYMNKLNFDLKADIDNGGTRLLFLDAGSCQLELICPPGGAEPREAGVIDHIAIECKHIEQWVEDCKARGVEFISEIATMPGLLGGVKNVFFVGPDGERIEFFEYLS